MIDYKISKIKPSNYDLVREKLKVPYTFETGLTFAYYPYIHNYKGKLSPDLLVHECVHLERQKEIGVEVWWNQYINDEEFRFKEELLAYRAQYAWIVKKLQKQTHWYWLEQFAKYMCSVYGFSNPDKVRYMNMIKAPPTR